MIPTPLQTFNILDERLCEKDYEELFGLMNDLPDNESCPINMKLAAIETAFARRVNDIVVEKHKLALRVRCLIAACLVLAVSCVAILLIFVALRDGKGGAAPPNEEDRLTPSLPLQLPQLRRCEEDLMRLTTATPPRRPSVSHMTPLQLVEDRKSVV